MNKSDAFSRLASAWCAWSAQHPWVPLVVAFLVTVAMTPLAATLYLDTNFEKMLPEDLPVVANMTRATAKVGGIGYFTVLAEHDDSQATRRFIGEMVERLDEEPLVRMTVHQNPVDFLREYQPLYVPQDRLKELNEYIKDERARANPFFADLRTEEEKAAEKEANEEKLQEVREKRRELAAMTVDHISEDGRVVGVQVRPLKDGTSLAETRDLFEKIEAHIDELRATGQYPDDLEVHIGGTLRNPLSEYYAVRRDVMQSAGWSALFVILMLLLVFKRPERLAVLLLPLMVGMVWALGLTAAMVGYLNLITATLMVVLLGLGIDHGIHLLERYLSERHHGKSLQDALRLTLGQTGKATLISGLTTAGGFLVMVWADFKGFSHLGLIAGVAMLTIILVYALTLPAVLVLVDRSPWLSRRVVGEHAGVSSVFWSWLTQRMSRIHWSVGLVLTVAFVILGSLSTQLLVFNENFEELMAAAPDAAAANAKQALVYDYNLRPSAVWIVPDDATADAIVAELERRRGEDTETPTIGDVVSLRDVLPPDREARLALVHSIGEQINNRMIKQAEDDELRDLFKDLREAKELAPLTWEGLPKIARAFFTPLDGSQDRVVYVFSDINRRDGAQARLFAHDMRPVEVGSATYYATGDTMIIAAMLDVVLTQGFWIFILSVLAIGVLLWLQYRQLRHTFRALLPLVVGICMMIFGLVLLNEDINFYNMAIFAAVVGMGIDSGIHIYNRWLEEGGSTQPGAAMAALAEVGAPVTASIATTAVGYLALALSDHPGLHSIGIMAFVGLATCYISAISIFPFLLRMHEHRVLRRKNRPSRREVWRARLKRLGRHKRHSGDPAMDDAQGDDAYDGERDGLEDAS